MEGQKATRGTLGEHCSLSAHAWKTGGEKTVLGGWVTPVLKLQRVCTCFREFSAVAKSDSPITADWSPGVNQAGLLVTASDLCQVREKIP